MKKITALLLVIVLSLMAIVSCTPNQQGGNSGGNGEKAAKIRIGCLSGPTGMGMAKMISDNGLDSDKYSFTVYGGPDAASEAFVAGDLDAICFPTNSAANLYGKFEGNLCVAAINCLGSLYLVTDSETEITSVKDLEGKTIYASVPNSTTGAIMNYILEKNGVNATVTFEYKGDTLSQHDNLIAKMLEPESEISIAVLPEPKATATMVTNPDAGLSIDLNLSTEWEKVSDENAPLTMGCIIFNKTFSDNNKAAVDAFLAEYKSSIEYINNKENNDSAATMIADAGILPATGIAKKALNNLYGSIVYIDGTEMKTALEAFYAVIGLSLPVDEFNYEK